MLYEGVSRPRRIALITVLVFTALISFGKRRVVALCRLCSLTFIHQASCLIFLIINHGLFFFLAVTSITVFLNLVTATLITLRILYFNRYIRKTVGLEHNSPYMTVIILCIESSALIIVFSLIYLILYFYQREPSVSPMLVHIYVSLLQLC